MDTETTAAVERVTERIGQVEHQGIRRHADVLHETLRDDIRLLAEGVTALSAKIDTMRP
jgi:hypothetical protein